MAKKGRGMPGGRAGGMPGGMGNIAKQIQKMQEDMVKAHEELAEETLEVTVGGGVVTVVITGDQRIRSISLKPEIVDPEDVEMLQDMLVAAVNQAIIQSQEMAKDRLEGLTGGLDIPGLPGMGF